MNLRKLAEEASKDYANFIHYFNREANPQTILAMLDLMDQMAEALKDTRAALITMRIEAESYGQAWARAYVKEYRDFLPGSAKEQFDLLGIMQDRLSSVANGIGNSWDALAAYDKWKEQNSV